MRGNRDGAGPASGFTRCRRVSARFGGGFQLRIFAFRRYADRGESGKKLIVGALGLGILICGITFSGAGITGSRGQELLV
ncbi:MAG: hypothetical protein ACXVC0_21820, partial [Bdellovibrionota bacterium]